MPSSNKLKSCGRKRPCWLEAHGDLLSRISIPESQTYDHNRVYNLIPKTKGVKPIARCKLQCLTDAIKLKKGSTFATQPPRRLYMYRDIQRFYLFEDYPTIVILGCHDPERKSKTYEFIRLEQNVAKELCDLIARAHDHPMCILVHDENTMLRYHSSQSSLAAESDTQQAHLSNQVDLNEQTMTKTENAFSPASSNAEMADEVNDFMDEVEQVTKQAYANHHENGLDNLIEEVKCETVSYPQAMQNHYLSNSPIPKHLLSDPMFKLLCAHVNEDELWAVDMKYVDSHPQLGNHIAERGSTYLFVAHHKYPEYHTNHLLNGEGSPEELRSFENTAEIGFTTAYVENYGGQRVYTRETE